MAEDQTPESTENETAPAAPEGNSDEGVTDEVPAPEQEKGDGLDSLPESWQREIKSLRQENADRRTKYNELKAELDNAKSQEDIDKAVEEYKSKLASLEREVSFQKHTAGLSEEAKALVVGSTDEEIKESSDRVRALLESASGTKHRDPNLDATGGIDPKSHVPGGPGNTPRELARQIRERSGRRR